MQEKENSTFAAQYLLPLFDAFQANANPEKALGMKQYMRNQFEFLGIIAPIRKALCKEFLKTQGLPPSEEIENVIGSLYQAEAREYQYFAVELVLKMHQKKRLSHQHFALVEQMIMLKSWWDTVDGISHTAGRLLKDYPQMRMRILRNWADSGNLWLRRITIIFQLDYREQTDETLLFAFCTEFAHSKEFFLQKAIGWALRQYARHSPTAVKEFVERSQLAPLSRREALKHFKRD